MKIVLNIEQAIELAKQQLNCRFPEFQLEVEVDQTSLPTNPNLATNPFLRTCNKIYLIKLIREAQAELLKRLAKDNPNFASVNIMSLAENKEFIEKYIEDKKHNY